jgi:hypothetical protein
MNRSNFIDLQIDAIGLNSRCRGHKENPANVFIDRTSTKLLRESSIVPDKN